MPGQQGFCGPHRLVVMEMDLCSVLCGQFNAGGNNLLPKVCCHRRLNRAGEETAENKYSNLFGASRWHPNRKGVNAEGRWPARRFWPAKADFLAVCRAQELNATLSLARYSKQIAEKLRLRRSCIPRVIKCCSSFLVKLWRQP